jgi:hypothetical protein
MKKKASRRIPFFPLIPLVPIAFMVVNVLVLNRLFRRMNALEAALGV